MRRKLTAAVLAVTIASANGSACAMNSPSAKPAACRVVDGAKLPGASGGADALCSAIEQVAGDAFSVEVRVLSPSSLTALVTTAEGRRLPEQRLDISDRPFTRGSFERFARNLAAEVARTSGRSASN
jgi:hypothetical protein